MHRGDVPGRFTMFSIVLEVENELNICWRHGGVSHHHSRRGVRPRNSSPSHLPHPGMQRCS